MSDLIKGSKKRTDIFLISVILILVVLFITKIQLINDDYYMMANWREVLKNGFYTKDALSMHHTYRASVEKWLSCALLYYIYHAWHITGIYIVMSGIICLIAFLIYRVYFYTSGNQFLALSFTIIVLTMSQLFFQVRPQVVTCVILLLEVLCLEHFLKDGKRKYLFILPVLSWLEMQFHSTIWPCFFMVLVTYLLDFRVNQKRIGIDKSKTKALAISSLACFGSLFLNPYGAWSVWYIFLSYGNKYMNEMIAELAQPNLFQSGIWVWGVVIVIAFLTGNKKMPTRYWLLFIGFFLFMWTAKRNAIFFDIIGAFPLCHMLREKKIDFEYNLVPLVPLLAALLLFPAIMTPHGPAQESIANYIEVIDKLADEYEVHGEDVFCDYNTGSYAEYVGYHPYFDSRAEIFTKRVNGQEELWKEYADMTNGSLYYKDFVNKYHFAYLIVDARCTPGLYNGLLHDDSYQTLFTYKDYAVFAPKK